MQVQVTQDAEFGSVVYLFVKLVEHERGLVILCIWASDGTQRLQPGSCGQLLEQVPPESVRAGQDGDGFRGGCRCRVVPLKPAGRPLLAGISELCVLLACGRDAELRDSEIGAFRHSDSGMSAELLRVLAVVAQTAVVCALVWGGTRLWLNRQRTKSAGLRGEIKAQVCFETTLRYASLLASRGYGGFSTRGRWIPLQRPRRLIVGTDAFIFSAPNALKEFVFRGRECSIAYSQTPSHFVNRDWIIITGQVDGRPVQLAISDDNLPEIWQALTGTGVAYGHEPVA